MLAGALVASAVLGWGAGAAAPAAEPAGRRDTHENLHAVLWMQTSAEYQAITRGLYHLAAAELDRAMDDPRWTAIPEQAGRPDLAALAPAVILDVDETVLDNSPEEGQRVLDRASYLPDLFARWATRAEAEAVPGADDFMRYALRRGVQIYLVTNRDGVNEGVDRGEPGQAAGAARPRVRAVPRRARAGEGDKSGRRQFVAAESSSAADGGRRPRRLRVDQRRRARWDHRATAHVHARRASCPRRSLQRILGGPVDRPAQSCLWFVGADAVLPDRVRRRALAKQFESGTGASEVDSGQLAAGSWQRLGDSAAICSRNPFRCRERCPLPAARCRGCPLADDDSYFNSLTSPLNVLK